MMNWKPGGFPPWDLYCLSPFYSSSTKFCTKFLSWILILTHLCHFYTLSYQQQVSHSLFLNHHQMTDSTTFSELFQINFNNNEPLLFVFPDHSINIPTKISSKVFRNKVPTELTNQVRAWNWLTNGNGGKWQAEAANSSFPPLGMRRSDGSDVIKNIDEFLGAALLQPAGPGLNKC